MIDTSSQVHFRLNQLTSRVCVAARLALESADRRARALDKCFWEPDMCGACSFASSSLVMLLQRRSISSVLVMGTYDRSSHCWVETFDDSGMKLFVDITATQFKNSKIYVTTPGEDRKYLEELRGEDAEFEAFSWLPGNEHKNKVSQICRSAEKLLLSPSFQGII